MFSRKNPVFTISSTSFRWIFISGRCDKQSVQGLNLFSKNLRKFDNTIHPLMYSHFYHKCSWARHWILQFGWIIRRRWMFCCWLVVALLGERGWFNLLVLILKENYSVVLLFKDEMFLDLLLIRFFRLCNVYWFIFIIFVVCLYKLFVRYNIWSAYDSFHMCQCAFLFLLTKLLMQCSLDFW